MIVLKILLIILIVFIVLFLLSLLIYFFNLDMKGAAMIMPVLEKIYDRQEKKREAKKRSRQE
jgi:flagellar basal body-associated protein FliL